jgi:hypothetical protein
MHPLWRCGQKLAIGDGARSWSGVGASPGSVYEPGSVSLAANSEQKEYAR